MKILLALLLVTTPLHAAIQSPASLALSRAEAERDTLINSSELKAFVETTSAATEQAGAQYASLFPRLSFDASYRYTAEIPNIPVPNLNIPFGSHTNYSLGPTLNYTVWDTFSARNAYHGMEKLAGSRDENRKNAELQLLLQVRGAYVRVQEDMEELRLVNDSLNLSRAQNRDIMARFRAGAASYLDRVESERDVLSYEIQFTQKQADLSSSLKDLLALTRDRDVKDLSHPGPPGIDNVTLELSLDSLQRSLSEENSWKITPPDDSHPQIEAQELVAQSSELQAKSEKDTLFPTIGLQARASVDYPNGPVLEQIFQKEVTVSLSMPIFEMDRTRHLTAQKMRESDSARYQKDQMRTDIQRDFGKSRQLLDSLLYQQKLAAQDVRNSTEAAHLYYEQYKAGKIYLIDVQTANNRALLSKVNAARIDAQILNQIDALRALSGKENGYD